MDGSPRRRPHSTIGYSQGQAGPPVGMFSPPNASHTRPRSSTPSSHHSTSQRHGSSSPFDYQYVSTPSNRRHASDTPKQPSSLKNLSHEEQHSQSPTSHLGLDPFQYQTGDSYTSYSTDAAAYSNASSVEVSAAVGDGLGDMTPEYDNSGSFDYGDGVQPI
ncbi:hypothetical protein GGS24DRAFT_459296 [Hypoxylon argillaceum]|nr:hypothetical protein GGS24DRAFT_459296 [Hypoxylon argillaceum]